jgi:hypothetical protein
MSPLIVIADFDWSSLVSVAFYKEAVYDPGNTEMYLVRNEPASTGTWIISNMAPHYTYPRIICKFAPCVYAGTEGGDPSLPAGGSDGTSSAI